MVPWPVASVLSENLLEIPRSQGRPTEEMSLGLEPIICVPSVTQYMPKAEMQ